MSILKIQGDENLIKGLQCQNEVDLILEEISNNKFTEEEINEKYNLILKNYKKAVFQFEEGFSKGEFGFLYCLQILKQINQDVENSLKQRKNTKLIGNFINNTEKLKIEIEEYDFNNKYYLNSLQQQVSLNSFLRFILSYLYFYKKSFDLLYSFYVMESKIFL